MDKYLDDRGVDARQAEGSYRKLFWYYDSLTSKDTRIWKTFRFHVAA